MNLSQANMLFEQALSAYQSKSFADAEGLWAAAGKLCAEGEQWIGVASCHLNRGNSLANLGRCEQSVADCEQSESIFASAPKCSGFDHRFRRSRPTRQKDVRQKNDNSYFSVSHLSVWWSKR